MALMMVREMLIQELRRHQLQYSIAQKLQALVAPQRQVVGAGVAVRESARQEADVPELHADALLELGQPLDRMAINWL